MLRERLKEIDIKITELADYLQLSRPTMYKFIEYYDNSEFNLINKKVLKLFNYINDNELVGRNSVISFILNNLVHVVSMDNTTEIDIIKQIKKYVILNPESKKSQFMVTCASSKTFDSVILYLATITPLLKKKKLSDEEKKILQPYINFLKEIGGK